MVVGLNLLSIGLRGYQYDVRDQHATVPLLKKRIAPSLYPRDLLLSQQQNAFSLFDTVMALPARWLGIEWAFFGWYLVATSLSAVLLWRIGLVLFRDPNAALLAATVCLCLKSTEARLVQLYDTYLTFRTAAFPFTLAAYYLLIRRRIGWAALAAGAELAIHPLTAISTTLTLAIATSCFCWRGWCRRRDVAIGVAIYVVCAGMLLLRVQLSAEAGGGLFEPMSRDWLRIIVDRTSYMFYSFWPASALLHVCLFPAMFLVFFVPRLRRDGWQTHLVPAVAVGVAVLLNLCAAIFADVNVLVVPLAIKLHLETARRIVLLFAALYLCGGLWRLVRLAQLSWQLTRRLFTVTTGRAVAGVVLLGWVVSAGAAFRFLDFGSPNEVVQVVKRLLPFALLFAVWQPRRARTWIVVVAALTAAAVAWAKLGGFLVCVAVVWLYARGKRGPELATGLLLALAACATFQVVWNALGASGEWVRVPGRTAGGPRYDLAEWMRTRTPVDALFMVPPRERGFRIHGERSIFVTRKDGGPVVYSKSYAREWSRRMALLDQYDRLRERHFLHLAETYDIDYAVTYADHELALTLAHKNERFRVYRLRPGRSDS